MSNVLNKGYIVTLDGIKEIKTPPIKYDSIYIPGTEISLADQLENVFSTENPEAVAYFHSLFNSLPMGPGGAQRKFDSNETIYLQRELVYIIQEIMKYWTPDFTAEAAFESITEGDPYAEFIEYRERTWNGEAQPASEDNTDMPIVKYSMLPTLIKTVLLEEGWEYSWIDFQKALSRNQNLDMYAAEDCKNAQDRAFNNWALGLAKDLSGNYRPEPADAKSGVIGLCSSANIDNYITSSDTVDYTDQTSSFDGTVLNNWNILTSSGATNRDNLFQVVNAPYNFTGNASAIPDTLYMGIKQGNHITTQIVNDAAPSVTVAKAILDAGKIKQIIVAPELNQVNKNSLVDPLFCFKRDRRIAAIRKTMPFFVLPTLLTPQYKYRTGTMQRMAGLNVFKKCIAVVKNTGA